MVVVVVPAFAHGHDRKQPVVAAGVGGLETARTEYVRQRVDGVSAVVKHHGGDEKGPHQDLQAGMPVTAKLKPHGVPRRLPAQRMHQASQAETGASKSDVDRHLVFVEPDQLGKFLQIAHITAAGRQGVFGGEPEHVRPQKSPQGGRMQIFLMIRMHMVVTVVGRPPQGAPLHAGQAADGHQALHRTRGAERAVGKITVVKTGDEEHPHHIEAQGKGGGGPREADPNRAQAGGVHEKKRRVANPLDTLVAAAGLLGDAIGDRHGRRRRGRSKNFAGQCFPKPGFHRGGRGGFRRAFHTTHFCS